MRTAFFLCMLMISASCFSQQSLTISEIQTTDSGPSAYVNQMVETTGVVTASAESDNLGFVYIQEPGVTEWGGIPLVESFNLVDLKIGDEVVVQGTVSENSGVTRIGLISSIIVTDSNQTISPIELHPSYFSSASFLDIEKYEGLLVRLVNGSDSVYVVDPDVGFGDYKIGVDTTNSNSGCLVLAGRQNSSTSSSLNVSFVTDSFYVDNDGMMNVPVVEVQHGDAFPWVQGVVSYGFSEFRLLPRNNADFGQTSTGLAPNAYSSIAVYPNPSNGQFNIDLPAIKGNAQLKVFNIDGRLVLDRKVSALDRRLSLKGKPVGVYQLRILSNEGVFQQRLLVR